MEDARFYEHEGLDPLGIARAVGRDLLGGGPMQGGPRSLSKSLKISPNEMNALTNAKRAKRC